MKAEVYTDIESTLVVRPHEKGDEPEDAVDVPPILINEFQKAQLALEVAGSAIIQHLIDTGQQDGS